MKRLALLLTGGAIWLFLAALPALADGGPHVSTINNGSLGINADSCAGCHRAHTAQGPYLINAADEEALCLTCHGASGTGSTVDVMTGVQYTLGADGLRDTAVLGATRNGGFDQARIDSSNVARYSYVRNAAGAVSQRPRVGVLAASEDVTSAHLALPENGLVMPGIAWGAGAFGDTAVGAAVDLSCASCHNPHGNGQYRILNPLPGPAPAGTVARSVTDAPLPPPGDTRNYTVIQESLALGSTLLASDVVNGGYAATDGDYFRRNVPWNSYLADPDCDGSIFGGGPDCTPLSSNDDGPNGIPSDPDGTGPGLAFNVEINAWCTTCHSRYLADGNTPAGNNPPYATDSCDPTFTYRHPTRGNRTCNVCHVAHGSNATMSGTFSVNATYPDGSVSASSRLLKIDNRGTCQACHDPTETVPGGTYFGPLPTPGIP